MTGFRELPREVRILTVVAFTVAVGFGIQSPAIPVFAGQFGVSSMAVGAVVSAFALMRLSSALPGGRLVNRFGERAILTTGMALLAATSVLAGLSWDYLPLLLFRGACGIGSALYSVSALSLLLRVTPPSHRGRAAGLFQGSFSLGTVTGPALGGGLLAISPRLPFFVYGAAVAVAMAFATAALARARPAPDARAPAPDAERVPVSHALRQQPYWTALTTIFSLGWAVFGVRVSVLPLFLLDVLGEEPTWIGVSLALGAVLQAVAMPTAGRSADLWGRKPSLILGEGLVLASLIVAMSWQALPGYLAAFALMGVGTAFSSTGGAATVGDVARGRGGTPVAAYQMSADLGMVAGPLVAGYLAESYSYQTALVVTAAVVLGGLAMAVAMRTRAA
ncbi:MFS family permease [Thermocatellispora tengchongensis]|uniref:MFS family permease n=1 Tax=Thermocatellispora tengchongensis TaxID=1073253 RepID=A0A840PEB2_9ACTN|nr:MFS transporter [Thermocatellispora tengchongensis]MBB5139764.1 MFS family permease [Thermocatellispora tengchongensis]